MEEHDEQHEHAYWPDLARVGLVGLATSATWFQVWRPVAVVDVIALAAAIVGGFPIYREALAALVARRMTMELSMTIAIAAALAIGEFFTGLVIVLFVLVAEILEQLTVARGRRAIKHLVDLLPRRVLRRRDGREEEVEAESVAIGETVIVKPGSRIPVDGTVIAGFSSVDQSTITGESMPVEKAPGVQVFAGTVNQSGVLELRTTGVGRDTAFGKIIEAVERAEKSRAPIQKTADRLAGYLVYFALACAALTFLITRDARSTIAVVIVAGACGIAAGTPLAILGAVGQAARLGVIVKGGLYMEALAHVDVVVLDKTGTVTFGNPEVTAIVSHDGASVAAVLQAAAIAEMRSEHPVAKAILRRAAEAGVRAFAPEHFEYTPGMGILCSHGDEEILVGSRVFLEENRIATAGCAAPGGGLSEVLVARDKRLLGSLQIADVLRPEAVAAVKALRDLGLRTLLLTGDTAPIAANVAKQLQVDEVGAELLPEDKLARVRTLLAEGKKVVVVGDGVNDAPALMQATVGIAMGSGTDVAMESAHVVLLGSDLLKLVETLRLARRCHRIIMQNFVGTLVVDGLGVALAAFGYLNPMFAAFIHVASELSFILNSARLLPGGSGARALQAPVPVVIAAEPTPLGTN